MNKSRYVPPVVAAVLVIGACALAWWVITAKPQVPPSSSPSVPSAVAHKVSEEEMGKVVLSEEAERRLGVQTAPVTRKSVRQVRVYGGEVTIPVGRTILVAAPLGGTLRAPQGGVPIAGSVVTEGQHIFYLLPLLSPEATTNFTAAKVDAEGQLNNAKTQLEMTKLALERAQRLFKGEAGSKRSVEEAQAQFETSQRTLEAAETRVGILSKAVGDATTGRASPIPIEAPETGILRNISALPDQNVPSGAPLFEVVDLTQVWIRVPVYVGDLETIVAAEPAEIGALNGRPGTKTWSSLTVAAPPSANPLAATVDLYYALDNREARFTPGQRVGATLSLSQHQQDTLTLPWSAVIYDIQGGTWVYQKLSPRTYKRERVVVRYAVDGVAVLASGPPVGAEIVTVGAQELFGAETGFSK